MGYLASIYLIIPPMRKIIPILLVFTFAITTIQAQTVVSNTETSDLELKKKATEWVSELKLNNDLKIHNCISIVFNHLQAVYNWNKSHLYTLIPEGYNPRTGEKLSTLDRQMIIESSKPDSIHQNLMNGLRKELSEEQIEIILDKYTVGKVAFTLAGYKAIVPDLTADEEKVILANLKKAREIAVDYKGMKQISAIFEIYKTKNEQFLIANGRNWRGLHKAFTEAAKARKATEKQTTTK